MKNTETPAKPDAPHLGDAEVEAARMRRSRFQAKGQLNAKVDNQLLLNWDLVSAHSGLKKEDMTEAVIRTSLGSTDPKQLQVIKWMRESARALRLNFERAGRRSAGHVDEMAQAA